MTFHERHSLEEFTPKVHAIVIAILVGGLLFFAALHYAYFSVNIWASWERGVTDREIHYAERVFNDSIFKTRVNTYSNYAFVVVGVYALALAYLDKKHGPSSTSAFIVANPLFGALFAAGCIYLGLSSGLYHASLTRLGQQLDVASMYAAMIALIAMCLYRYVPRIPGIKVKTSYLFALVAVAACVYLFVYKWEMSSKRVLPGIILTLGAFVIADIIRKRSRFIKTWAAAGFITVIVGYACRQIDIDTDLVPPDTIFQGHSAWHILCAASLGLIYMFYRSEIHEEV